jgi:acyl carrier protein
MSDTQEIKSKLKTFILSEFLPGESADNLGDDTPLRTSGILDSLSTIKLVSFVEDTFGIEIEAHETGIQDFDRIEDIAALVARKKSGG